MATRTIRVSEAEDRKLWRLIVKNKWNGTCLDPYTYLFTTEQLQVIKRAGIDFEDIKSQSAREPAEPAPRIASGARQR